MREAEIAEQAILEELESKEKLWGLEPAAGARREAKAVAGQGVCGRDLRRCGEGGVL